jgi:hypothetical protein
LVAEYEVDMLILDGLVKQLEISFQLSNVTLKILSKTGLGVSGVLPGATTFYSSIVKKTALLLMQFRYPRLI